MAGRRDALTGAGLVCLLPLVVICTFWLLSPNDGTVEWTLAIGVGASVLAVSLLWLPWDRLPASLLLVFPGIMAVTLIATANLERTITASYVGFLTVSFIYIGLTQSRLMPLLAMPIAVPIYLLCELRVTPAIDVRLPIAAVTWLLIGEVLADRSMRSRRQTALLAAQLNRHLETEADRITAEGEKKVAERVRLQVEAVRITAEGEKEVAERVRLEVEAHRITAEGEKRVAERVRLEVEAHRIRAEGEKTVAEHVRLEAEADRGRLVAQLNQSQRLESLGQLAGGVAHDFNNLLGVILNYAAFVAGELTSAAATPTGTQWEEPLRDVKQIQLAAERGALLTRQLLSFARREVVQARALSLNSAITRMEQILRRTIGEQIELVINLATILPMVLADPGQIEQIVLNLAINARDAMPTGGTLSIDTAVREITEIEASLLAIPVGSYISFRVSDTGVGMPPEIRDRAFEPFFTTKPAGEGAGLGLATVYGIVAQSGGYTRIYSDEGVGTAITILLPPAELDEMHDEISGGNDLPEPLVGTETILIVDDEEGQREVARRILTRNGYTVLTASNGAIAIELAASYAGPIDLLLTDVIMPVMPGPIVAQEVRILRHDIRVLFMSGHAQPVLEAEALLGAEFPLMEKPFDEAKVLHNVRKVLHGNE